MSKHKCRFCNSNLDHTFCDLGNSPLSNAYISCDTLIQSEPFYPLHAFVCSHCFLVQLPSFHRPAEIFEEYAYFSSYSSSWLEHAKAFAKKVVERFSLRHTSQVIEIASNDGYLLQFFKQLSIPILGIEPAKNVAACALEKKIPTLVQFFNRTCARTLKNKADLLIGNNVLAHVPDLNDFVAGMKIALKPTGVISIEVPHLLQLIEKNQFDTIYHEHFSYFSLHTVSTIFAAHGLEIFDVEQLPTHGGSLRLFVKHQNEASHMVQSSVQDLLDEEKKKNLNKLETYLTFPSQVDKVKAEFLNFLHHAKTKNKRVIGYGAPAKGNTLLNYCKVSTDEIPFTVDKSVYKQGRLLPGSHLPIYPVEKIAETRPDYLVILPWNLKQEIIHEMSFISTWGGKFVVPIPQLEILDVSCSTTHPIL